MESHCNHFVGFCKPMMSNENLSSDVTCAEDYRADVVHINIKQEPHTEDEYQVSTLMTVNWWHPIVYSCY
jgi:hypothetical protein